MRCNGCTICGDDCARSLISELGEIESEMKALDGRKSAIRALLTTLVTNAGGKIELPDVGSAVITKAANRVMYDVSQVDSILTKALANGDVETAHALSLARSESKTNGYLTVKRK